MTDIFSMQDGEPAYLTKGDNNMIDDTGLYKAGDRWVRRSQILGVASGALPHVGTVTILLNDYPYLKILLVSVMGLCVVTSRES